MTQSWQGPSADPPAPPWAAHPPYASANAPISTVPSAARDYAELDESPAAGTGPIEPSQVPAAPAAYAPPPRYSDGPAISPPPGPATAGTVPISDVPLDRPGTPETPDAVIAALPFALPMPDVAPPPHAEPAEPIRGVPSDLPRSSPPTPAPAATAVAPARTPWWRLLLGGR